MRHRVLCLLMIAILVTGCTSRDWRRFGYVQGLEPTLSAGAAATSTTNQESVLLSLAHRANLRSANDDLANIKSQEWSTIAEAGFNLVDEQCEQYIDALFWWNRYKSTTTTEISLVGAATAAFLGIAQASAAAIAITATAFGLTAATVDNIGNSVLYELEPSGLKTLVDRARATYRAGVSPERIDDRPTAVAVIQGYLSLCLPASIETQVNEAIIDTAFVAVEDSRSAVPELRRVSTTQQAGVTAAALRSFEPKQPPTAEEIAEAVKGALGPIEQTVQQGQLERIQSALCVEPDGIFGENTWWALAEYRAGIKSQEPTDEDRTMPITVPERETLQSIGSCESSGFLSPFERATLREVIGRTTTADRVEPLATRTLQVWVNRLMGGAAPTLTSSIPTPEVRRAIENKRRELNIEDSVQLNTEEGPTRSITAELWFRVRNGE